MPSPLTCWSSAGIEARGRLPSPALLASRRPPADPASCSGASFPSCAELPPASRAAASGGRSRGGARSPGQKKRRTERSPPALPAGPRPLTRRSPGAGPAGSRGSATPGGSGQSSAGPARGGARRPEEGSEAPQGSGAASVRARCRRAGEEGGGGPRSLPAPAGGSVLPRSADKRGKMSPGRAGELPGLRREAPHVAPAAWGRHGEGEREGARKESRRLVYFWHFAQRLMPSLLHQQRKRTGCRHSLLPFRSYSETVRLQLKVLPPRCVFFISFTCLQTCPRSTKRWSW